jgi:hypothetical protein
MCGPADYEALNTCVVRIAGLSAAGFSAYMVHRATGFYRGLKRKRISRVSSAPIRSPRKLTTESSGGRTGS